jgi:hypothetical protein
MNTSPALNAKGKYTPPRSDDRSAHPLGRQRRLAAEVGGREPLIDRGDAESLEQAMKELKGR